MRRVNSDRARKQKKRKQQQHCRKINGISTHSVVMMLNLCSQLCQTHHLPTSIRICPWIPSSLGASAPFIAATNALASADSCIAGAAGAMVLPGAAPTAVVADVSVCSRRSSAQCLFNSLELAKLLASDLQLQGSTCSHGACADSGSAGEFVVPLSGSRQRRGVNSGSDKVGEHEITGLIVPHQPGQYPHVQ